MKTIICLIAGLLILSSGCDSTSPSEDIPSPTIVWSFPFTTENESSLQPLIENERVYIGHDRNISCAELATGRILWSVPAGNYASFSYRTFLSDGNLLYFYHHSGLVRAFNKNDGAIIWQNEIPNFGAQSAGFVQNSSHLFVSGNDGQIVRLNKFTGAEDLRFKADTLALPETVQRIWNMAISPDGNLLYVPTEFIELGVYGRQGNLLCYDAHSGKLVWGKNIKPQEIPYDGGIMYSETGIRNCIITRDIVIFPANGVVFGLNRFSGEKIWEKTFTNEYFQGTIAADNNFVYLGGTDRNSDGHLCALKVTNGDLHWITNQDLGGSFFQNELTILNGKIVFATGYINAIDQFSGRIVWQGKHAKYNEFNTKENEFYRTAVAYNGEYIVNIGDKKVYCLKEPKF